jgi:predicted RNase H-like HicB family nuclease
MKTPPKQKAASPTRKPLPERIAAVIAALREVFKSPEAEHETTESADGTEHTARWHLQVCVEPDEVDGGYVASVIDLPGCVGQGETKEEAVRSAVEAMHAIVDVKTEAYLKDRGLAPSETASETTLVTINVP